MSHEALFEYMHFDNRHKWDPDFKYKYIEKNDEYELMHILLGKIPFYTQRDISVHNMYRKSFFIQEGKPDIHVRVAHHVDSPKCPKNPDAERAKQHLQGFIVEDDPSIDGARLTVLANVDLIDMSSWIMP